MGTEILRGMTHRPGEPVLYSLGADASALELSDKLGQDLSFSFTGKRSCIACGRVVKKLFQNGYCFPCVTSLAECDLCIVKPHECHFHLGTCRDAEFAQTHCMIPHYVYLAFSSGFKVGLTRKGREMTRWVDQGASTAILLAEVPTRKQAGELEMEVAKHLADKTDWRKMLKGIVEPELPITELKQQVVARLDSDYKSFVVPDDTVHNFMYPREADFNVKLTSFSFDKTPEIKFRLRGIKGQYLLFDEGILNIKRHAGYEVEVAVL